MRRMLGIVLALVPLLAVVPGGAAAQEQAQRGGGLRHLAPGAPADYTEQVPVNVVFVGYDRDDVDAEAFLADLPQTTVPVNRQPSAYAPEPLGIRYTYDYDLTYAGGRYEDRFFAELAGLAVPETLTAYQALYNDQEGNVLDVAGNHHIDAPTVERWLAENPPRGVDTAENTLYFINWYGRDDFRHHVYTKLGEPDPDTGTDFGLRDSRKLIAWGGTTPDDEESGLGRLARVWFYDLSAGPESFTDNWNVDDADLDGDGEADYRMPPIWEYTEGGYRDPAELTPDLAKVARYVGVNLLFTSSPLYRVDLDAPDLPESINLDTNTYEGLPGTDASEAYIDPDLFVSEIAELRPLNRFDYDHQDLPLDGDVRRCLALFYEDEPCFPELEGYPAAYGNLYLPNALLAEVLLDGESSADYELPNINYAVSDEEFPPPFLGLADDDYRTGTQSFTYNFVSPGLVEAGYGLTTTLIHEDGHHLGLSHPMDGYDSETGVDYGPSGPFYFAWSGTESNSMMSYVDLNWDFSQFDRDNSNRFLAEAYAKNANRVLALIQAAGGDDARTNLALRVADARVGLSEREFAAHRYDRAAANAERAYRTVAAAAERLGVPVERAVDPLAIDAGAVAAEAAAAKIPYALDAVDYALRKRLAP